MKDLFEEIGNFRGQIIGITSQTPNSAFKIKRNWELPWEVISDPVHALLGFFRGNNSKAKYFGTYVVAGERGDINNAYFRNDRRMSRRAYQFGVAQPAAIIVDKNQRVLFRWYINPSISDLYGAGDRPSVEKVFQVVKMKLSETEELDDDEKIEEQDFGDFFTTGRLKADYLRLVQSYCSIQ